MTLYRHLLPIAVLGIPALLLTACPAADTDGDGVADDADCEPDNPAVFPGQTEDPTKGTSMSKTP